MKEWKNYSKPVRVNNESELFDSCFLKYAAISDIHLGHRRTLTNSIIDNLNKQFTVDFLKTIDILFIVGDLFDRLLTFGSEEANASVVWASQLLANAKNAGCMVRVLEGTRSHDYGQSTILQHIANVIGGELDFKYVSTLSIEYISKYDSNVLYIPDNWKTTADEVWSDVNEVMSAHGLSTVDITMIHGGFDFQLPVQTRDTHDSSRYVGITKYACSAGHIHIPNQLDNILVQGSFDRLSHNEEHDKGFMRVGISNHGVCYSFIVNENAKKYVTLDVVGKSIEDVLSIVQQRTHSLPDGSYVRLRAAKTDPITVAMASLSDQYPQFNWGLVDDKDTKNVVQDNIINNIEFKANTSGFSITSDNIKDVINGLLTNNLSIDMNVIDTIVEECL